MTNPTHCLLIELEIPEGETEFYLKALTDPEFKAAIQQLLSFQDCTVKVGVIEVMEEPSDVR